LIRKNINLTFDEFEILNVAFDNSRNEILKFLNKGIIRKFESLLTVSEIGEILNIFYNNITLKFSLFKKLEIVFVKEFQMNLCKIFNDDLEMTDAIKIEFQTNFENFDKEEIKVESTTVGDEKIEKFVIENKLNQFNIISNSSSIGNLMGDNEYSIMFSFLSGGVVVKPNGETGLIKAFIQQNFILFNYNYELNGKHNKHFIYSEDLGINIEIFGYPQLFLFYDKIGFRRNMVVQIVKMRRIGKITNSQANEIRDHRRTKSGDFDFDKRDNKKNEKDKDDNYFKDLPEVDDVPWDLQ